MREAVNMVNRLDPAASDILQVRQHLQETRKDIFPLSTLALDPSIRKIAYKITQFVEPPAES